MQTVAEYIRALAIFMVFSALVDILSPSSSFKKYINLILGLILIGFMLEPLANMVHKTNNFLTQTFNKYQHIADTRSLRQTSEKIEAENAAMVVSEYKKRLAVQITDFVEERTGTKPSECQVIVNEDYNSIKFAEIHGIHLAVPVYFQEQKGARVKAIAFGNSYESLTKEQVEESTEADIKKCLMDFYNIDESNIHITVQ